MAFFLTGGGDQDDFRNLDRFFLDSLQPDSRILVVPHALDEADYEDALERAEECFAGNKVAELVLAEDLEALTAAQLADFAVVFLEGGNTFQLIETVRRSNFFQLLGDFSKRGGHIYADSAGAIVLGSDVKTAFLGEEADEDYAKLQDYRGLGILDAWSVHCHYELEEAEDLNELLYQTGSPILALREPTGVYVTAEMVQVFGKAPLEVFSFTGHKVIPVGAQASFDELMA